MFGVFEFVYLQFAVFPCVPYVHLHIQRVTVHRLCVTMPVMYIPLLLPQLFIRLFIFPELLCAAVSIGCVEVSLNQIVQKLVPI